MTSNQIAYRDSKTRERDVKEKERANKAAEKEKAAQRKQDRNLKLMDLGIKGAGLVFGGANDPSWYNLDPQMVKDVASLSFQTPLGYVEDTDTDMQTYAIKVSNHRVIDNHSKQPGVMAINVVPTIGDTDLVNTAGLNIYAYVRHANSGSRNYEYQDLMKYLLAVDSIYIGIQELKRLYAILNTYKAHNKYYAQGYLKALGLDYEADLTRFTELADLRYKINQLAVRVNSFYVPKIMSMYQRHAWMATGIFKDQDIKKSCNYMFHFTHVYKYDEVDNSATFGQLKPVTLFGERSIMTIVAQVDSLLTSLERSEDIGIMSGDILKAYGETGLYYVDTINEDYKIEETYSSEVLSQINNTCLNGRIDPASLVIYENDQHKLIQGFNSKFNNSITPELVPLDWNSGNEVTSFDYPYCSLMWDTDTGVVSTVSVSDDTGNLKKTLCNPRMKLINFYKDSATPDDVMVATRLTTHTQGRIFKTYNETNRFTFVNIVFSYGTEIATEANIVYFDNQGNLQNYLLHDGFGISYVSPNRSLPQFLIKSFDWAPRIRLNYFDEDFYDDSNKAFVSYHNRDLCNTAIIAEENIRNMHRVAVTSELGIPLLGLHVRTR